jgi:hypothetical protein
METGAIRFDTRAGLEEQFRACLAASSARLDLFDPDYAVFPLGEPEVDALLRAFLKRGGSLRLALHASAHIERHYPRFLRLLRDYSHQCECRQTPRSLRELRDSFCIGDDRHVVRRFHSDHMRGVAAFDAPAECELPAQRFLAIWEESRVVLQPTTTGL